MSIIKFSGRLTLALCRNHPDKFFVFGDNLKGVGTAGQACIRHARNSIGIPTKVAPAMSANSFARDDDAHFASTLYEALDGLWDRLDHGDVIVLPCDDSGNWTLGTGLARMESNAPFLFRAMNTEFDQMVQEYGIDAVFGSVSLISACKKRAHLL